MKNNKTAFSVLIAISAAFCANSQSSKAPGLDTLAGNLVRFLRSSPQEKILLQTDKWFYLSGETIWYKAYSLNALSNKFTVQSKNLFVDLVDDHDRVVQQQLINLTQKRLNGNIEIPPGLPEGYYWIRAYTRKILDEDSNKIFVQPVYVLNPRKPDTTLAEQMARFSSRPVPKDLPPNISFYPEGGSLISGSNSVIAFRCLDQQGVPVEVSGFVTDNLDSVVTKFKSVFGGIGKFAIDVWKSRKYTAHIKWKGKQIDYPLPAVNQFASQISVISENEHTYHVRVSLGDSLYHKDTKRSLIGFTRDSICFLATGQDMYEIYIPKSSFPKGMATLLLFDENKKVVSERNIYINRDNEIVSINMNKLQYGPREKATFDVLVTDSNHLPLRAVCSVAITDDNMDKQPGMEFPSSNIIQIRNKTPITSIKYTAEEFDLLMLTQREKYKGWTYQPDSIKPAKKSYLTDSSFELIKGRILDHKDEPVPNQVVTLFATQENIIFLVDTTDKQGRFNFRLSGSLADSSVLNLQVANQKGTKQDKKIVMDPPPFPNPKTPALLKKRFDMSRQTYLREFKTSQMDTTKFGKGKEWLKEVTVLAAKKKPVNYDERKRLSPFSAILTSDQFDKGGLNSLGMALLTAPGIHLKMGFVSVKGGFNFGHPSKTEPMIVVDGVPILFDSTSRDDNVPSSRVMSYLSSINPSNVDFIEVLAGAEASVYGYRGAFGIISINTSPLVKNDDAYTLRGLKKIYHTGYASGGPFMMPNYMNKEVKKSPYPDNRSTLYWNPYLLTDETGFCSADWFTADPPTTYTITVMGVTENGGFIFKQAKIERK